MEKKNTNLLNKKITKISHPSPHSAAMNSEFTVAWRGLGWGYL